MKKNLLLLFALLLGAISSSAQDMLAFGVKANGADSWGWNPTGKVQLRAGSQWAEFKIHNAAFSTDDYDTYTLKLSEPVVAGDVQFKFVIDAENSDYVDIPAGETTITGTFTAGKNYTNAEIQAKKAGAVIKIESFELSKGSTKLSGTYENFWGWCYLSGTFTSSSSWAELNIELVDSEVPNQSITIKGTIPENMQFKTHYTDGDPEEGYPAITAGTSSTTLIARPCNKVAIQAKESGITITINAITCTIPAEIDPTYGWATYVGGHALDFSGVSDLKAYMVLGHDGANVTKTQVTGTVPAGTGLLLNGVTANIPVVASSSTDVSANKLKRGTGAGVATESGKTKYVLSHDGTAVKFLKVSESPTVDKGKAYLEFNEVISARSLDFDGDATAIKNIKVGSEDNVYYDLQGRRVLYPTKGLYIVNGKKVILK